LTSRGWVDPVPDPLLLRKSGSAGDRTRDLCICSQKLSPLDHRGGPFRTLRADKKETYCTSNNYSRDSYCFAYHLTIISTRAIFFTLRVYFLFLLIFLSQGEVEHSSNFRKNTSMFPYHYQSQTKTWELNTYANTEFIHATISFSQV